MPEVISIVCAFTRLWAIEQWLKDLAAVPHDPALTNLCFIIDADEPNIKYQIEQFAKGKGYRRLELEMNFKWAPNETNLTIRRKRIADIKEQHKEQVRRCDGEFVIGLEDDTVFGHLDGFEALVAPFREHTKIGFVEGVQIGRWGVAMVGAWKFDDVTDPRHVETLLPPTQSQGSFPYEHITAGGFYCYATRRHLYLDAPYYWSESQPWGPDVNFGLWLRTLGYRCMIKWDMLLGHNDHGPVGWPNTHALSKVEYNKDRQTGRWIRRDTDEAALRY